MLHRNGWKIFLATFTLLFIVFSAGIFSANVQFNPDGVKAGQVPAYRAALARIEAAEKAQSELAANLVNLESMKVPKAVVADKAFDFGLLDPHVTVSHSFTVSNEGDADLLLTTGETSCKCTIGDLGSPIVPPGASTEVTLTWNTGYQSARYTQSAAINTNDPTASSIDLSVSGTIKAELALTSTELVFPPSSRSKLVETGTYLFSQLFDDFVVESATSDLPGFQWAVEPVEVTVLPRGDLDAKSAWKLKVMSTPQKVGDFSGKVDLTIVPTAGGEKIERQLSVSGKVKSPIAFVDPEIHDTYGLPLGIMQTGKEHRRSIIVRLRDDVDRAVEVLMVKPDQMRAQLEPTGRPGAYRLTLIAPADATPVVFNLDSSHGLVQVGDPNDKLFTSWMPVTGAIISPAESR